MARSQEIYYLDDEATEGDGLEIAETHVGKGVFATRAFPNDSIVGEITGELIHDVDYESDYCIWLGDDAHLEPAPPFRFLNHSCDANCDFDVFEVEEMNDKGEWIKSDRVYLYAVRDIESGEQLTLDYCWPADAAIVCQCGAESCRGWVVAAEELHLIDSDTVE